MTTLPAAAQASLDDVDSRESDTLLLAANGDPWLSESLARRARAGAVVRLANGVYCETESWLRCPPWDRYLLAVVAHARSRRREVVFCHITAAIPGGGAAALEREKRRELQLARLGYDVVRWIDADLSNPRDFGRILASHGVPLRT